MSLYQAKVSKDEDREGEKKSWDGHPREGGGGVYTVPEVESRAMKDGGDGR